MNLRLWLLLSVFVLPLFVSLDTSAVWDSNEAFYVQTPREMLATSDWIVPRFNGQARLNKPPLSYWLVASLYSLFGVSVFWERLLTAMCGLATVLAVLQLGRQLFSVRIAVLAAGILATTFRFLILSRRALIEILLLALLLWALVFLLQWAQSTRPIFLYGAALLLALAFLTKGPLVLLVPFIFAVFLIISGRKKLLLSRNIAPALVLFLVVAGSWFIALGIRYGWGPVSEFFLLENLGRYTSLEYGPQRGIFYYPLVFLGDFLPWSLFFVVSLLWWLMGDGGQMGKQRRQSMLFLGLWIAAWMAVFSFSHNKQEYYILPVYPAAALWLACYFQGPRFERLAAIAAGFIIFPISLVLAAGMTVLAGPSMVWWMIALPAFGFSVFVLQGYWKAASASLSLFFLLAFHLCSGPLENFRPIRQLAEQIEILESEREGNFRAGYWKLASPSLAFYLNQPILQLFKLEEAVEALSSKQRTYLIVEESELRKLLRQGTQFYIAGSSPRLSTNLRSFFQIVQSGRWTRPESWTRQVFLVSNQPTA